MEAIDFDKLRAMWAAKKEKRDWVERRIACEKAEKNVRQSVDKYSDMLRQGRDYPEIREDLYGASCEDARAIVDRIILANPTLKDTISVRCPNGSDPIVIVKNPK